MRTITEKRTTLEIVTYSSSDETSQGISTVHSRFGDIKVDKNHTINFKHGLLGLPSAVSFCLTKLPQAPDGAFKVLQCLDDHDLAFLVVPADINNQIIAMKDVQDACETLSIPTENLLILFIATIHDEPGSRYVSINAKAPILIDAISKTAAQYVLQNASYEIQHRLS